MRSDYPLFPHYQDYHISGFLGLTTERTEDARIRQEELSLADETSGTINGQDPEQINRAP